MEVLFNLDENINLLQKATFTQDFREVHSKCWVLVAYPDRVDFSEGFGFIYMGLEWEAVSYKRVDREGGHAFLSILGYPKGVCTLIDKKHNNLSSLAKSVGTRLAEGYTNLEFEFPLRNILLGPLLYKYRFGSMERYINSPSQSWFLFYDDRGVLGCSYNTLSQSNTVLEYNMELNTFLGGTYSFIRDYQLVQYYKDHSPSYLHYKNSVGRLIGDKFDLKGNVPALIGVKYRLSGQDEALFKKYDKLILVRQKYDTSKQPLPWVLTFGQLLAG